MFEIKGAAELLMRRGNIFIASFGHIHHPKFFVVIGEDDNCVIGAFFINSEVNRFIIRTKVSEELQISISNTDYSFLDHPSFIDCSKIIKIKKEEFIKGINVQEIQFKDTLKEHHIQYILEKVRNSTLYNKSDKDTYFK